MAVQNPCYTLITGASSGIGRALAIRLSQTSPIILHGRDFPRLEETRCQCVSPESHVLWPYDLKLADNLAVSLTKQMTDSSLLIDCFIHCAGIFKIMPLRGMAYEMAKETLEINFVSALEIIKVLIKKKINNLQLKNILFISSTASKYGAKGLSLYCASKGALDSFMRALAVELAPDIRVNSILPGGVRSRMTESMFADPEMAARLTKDYPLGAGEIEDIVNAAEFIISEKARWITGQQLIIDGGRTINISA